VRNSSTVKILYDPDISWPTDFPEKKLSKIFCDLYVRIYGIPKMLPVTNQIAAAHLWLLSSFCCQLRTTLNADTKHQLMHKQDEVKPQLAPASVTAHRQRYYGLAPASLVQLLA